MADGPYGRTGPPVGAYNQLPEYPAASVPSPQRSPATEYFDHSGPPPPPPHRASRYRNSGAARPAEADTAYGGRTMSPSPEGDSDPYQARASQVPAGAYASRRPNAYDAFVDPHNIADDADDGFEEQPPSRGSRNLKSAAGTSAGGGAGAGMLKAFGGSRDTSGDYGQVPGGQKGDPEKSEWLKNNSGRSKKLKYIFGVLGVLIVCGIVAGVVGGILATNGSSSTETTSSDTGGKYDINSPEVQDLLNNPDLHRVFPSMDYTPLNGQYPDCLTNPPTQDNVTLDVAVLSQLTPSIRLYGTDCEQTEMVLTAIEKLDMTDSLKVWLGVWLDSNSTSNSRQLEQMYTILDKYDSSHFAGVIIGNEVLFREDMTEAELGQTLNTARTKIHGKGINVPVSTSDLGDNWTSGLAAYSDIVMASVHPFFAGGKPDAAPGWTWTFWTTHDVILAEGSGGSYPKSIISETGWPTQGGNDCGVGGKCTSDSDGAVAGIDELNTFMEGWVCESIANGTTYFWFEAFDEPWKVMFNDPQTGDFWEPHWGLLDVNRVLKEGVKIPDCDGKTLTSPY